MLSTRRTLLAMRCLTLALSITAALTGTNAWSQAFPNKPIHIIVPYAPGATDREARMLADIASEDLGQPIIVENRDGAGGIIGGQFVASSKPDGYTMLYAAPAVITVAPIVGKPPYKYEDLVGLARATITPHLLATNMNTPFKTLQELVAYAKANPGKVTFGSPGTGTAVHLAGEAFAKAAGIKLTHVPFRGLAPAVTAVIAGTVDIVIGAPGAINTQIEAGRLRPLAQFGDVRAAALSTVPTLRESGVDLALRADFGFFLPKGTPPAIVSRLDEAFGKATNSAKFKTFVETALVAPAFLPAAEYQKVLDAEREIYRELGKTLELGSN